MSNEQNINNIIKSIEECIFCEEKANYIYSCLHHLCKNCYRIEKFCAICNTSDIILTTIVDKKPDIKTNYLDFNDFALSYAALRYMNGLGGLHYSS